MITIEKDMTLREVFDVMGVEQYTRYPVTDGDKDHIIGLVNMKNLLTAFIKEPDSAGNQPVTNYMQPIIHVIERFLLATCSLKSSVNRFIWRF